MKETTPAATPPCFDRWCKRFDELFNHQAQKREFRNYIGGLLGESERKNLSQIIGDKLRLSASCQGASREWLKEKLVRASLMFRKRCGN